MNTLRILFLALFSCTVYAELEIDDPAQPPVKMPGFEQNNPSPGFEDAARGVFTRLGLDGKIDLDLSQSSRENGCQKFQTEVLNNRLFINASSGVAMCHALYDYMTRHGMGIVSWSGNRIAIPEKLPYEVVHKVISPVQNHYYLNVVTFGYTMPYWDWERWEKEIDWMVMHGIDMPLALVANEAISKRVFKKLGFTDDELDSFYTGPAHLPWNRMGNLVNHDGPLPQSWHDDQVRLQHQILNRMRSLGMRPICPAFSGFVPRGIERIYPGAKIQPVRWGGFAPEKQAIFLLPDPALAPDKDPFVQIGELFIKEWEKEFKPSHYYLLDMFNEMDLPIPKSEVLRRHEILAEYGSRAYRSLSLTNHNVQWVMQGWMFGYQRNIWTQENLRSFLSRVPDEKVVLLDLAADYNKFIWRNEMNWDYYNGFFNKQWVYSVIPNMGGKTSPTGVLDFYANGHVDAVFSPHKGNLVGIGMAPEGIENNELIYELLSDVAWTKRRTDVSKWLKNYAVCRYGSCPKAVETALEGMRKTVYASFTDHPRFNWQLAPGTRSGTVRTSEAYLNAIRSFAKAVPLLKNQPLYMADLREYTALALAVRMESLSREACEVLDARDTARAMRCFDRFQELGRRADACLEAHPYLNLRTWLGYTERHDASPEQAKIYAANARRLITVWGPPVEDYAAKVWGGLIRSYYLPRWQIWFDGRLGKKTVPLKTFEEDWVRNGADVAPMDSPDAETCAKWIEEAFHLNPSKAK